ncbi:hypothetical protein V2O64_11510 [Verrucomicrobiaceae bacterium 227]
MIDPKPHRGSCFSDSLTTFFSQKDRYTTALRDQASGLNITISHNHFFPHKENPLRNILLRLAYHPLNTLAARLNNGGKT